MSNPLKQKIYQLLENVEDETILNQVMEDVEFYTSSQDVIDSLSPKQLNELDEAISEADKGETISWEDFKNEMNEWKKQ